MKTATRSSSDNRFGDGGATDSGRNTPPAARVTVNTEPDDRSTAATISHGGQPFAANRMISRRTSGVIRRHTLFAIAHPIESRISIRLDRVVATTP